MTVNLTNLNRLIAELERMKRDDAGSFDYTQGYSVTDPHCVDCVCRRLMGQGSDDWLPDGGSIANFLSIDASTARALWSPFLSADAVFGTTADYGNFKGEVGLSEALRRLNILRSLASDGREQAFIAELRASFATVDGCEDTAVQA